MQKKLSQMSWRSKWSPRERELLSATFLLLQRNGYGGLTLDDLAATARTTKRAVYRRWPTKAELVLAAFAEGLREVTDTLNTGSLRGDLMLLGDALCAQAMTHAATVRALLDELSRSPALSDVIQQQLLEQKQQVIRHVLGNAFRRGEIEAAAVTEDLWELLPGYLIFRAIWSIRPPTRRTVQTLVDDLVIPSLTRGASCE